MKVPRLGERQHAGPRAPQQQRRHGRGGEDAAEPRDDRDAAALDQDQQGEDDGEVNKNIFGASCKYFPLQRSHGFDGAGGGAAGEVLEPARAGHHGAGQRAHRQVDRYLYMVLSQYLKYLQYL